MIRSSFSPENRFGCLTVVYVVCIPLILCICQHRRQRNKCRDCKGAGICTHGRQRNLCPACGGASICQHSRVRGRCPQCPCNPHGVERAMCVDCLGADVCQATHRTDWVLLILSTHRPHITRFARQGIHPCPERGQSKFDRFCRACFVHIHPDDQRSAKVKAASREMQWVVRLLQDPDIIPAAVAISMLTPKQGRCAARDGVTKEPRNWTRNRCLYTSLPGKRCILPQK